MGRYADRRLAGTSQLGRAVNWQEPLESPEVGCPGAWYRTPYIDSLYPYFRRRDANGNRVANPRFDAADWQVQAAVMRIEAEEERWHAHIDHVALERAKARAKAHEQSRKGGRR